MFEVNYLRGKYNEHLAAPLKCLPLFFAFTSEVLKGGMKGVLTELFFKMEFVKNTLVYVFGVFPFSIFVTVFIEGFIPKIILLSGF